MDVAEAAGITALRIVRSASRGPTGLTVRRLAARLERTARAGASASRPWDRARRGRHPGRAPPGTGPRPPGRTPGASAELATHPGEAGDPDLARYRWGYVWDRELEALVDPAVRRRVRRWGSGWAPTPTSTGRRDPGGGGRRARPDAAERAGRLRRPRARRPLPRGGALAVVPVPGGRGPSPAGRAGARRRLRPRLVRPVPDGPVPPAGGGGRRRRRGQAGVGPPGRGGGRAGRGFVEAPGGELLPPGRGTPSRWSTCCTCWGGTGRSTW